MPTPGNNDPQAVAGSIPASSQTSAATSPTVGTSTSVQTSAFSIKLPEGCGFIESGSATTVAICPAPSEPLWEKLIVSSPSLLLSMFAIFIAFRTFGYNRGKDQRTRLQSIQDDYWIRKIISPISIEPFLKFVTELSSSLPMAKDATDSQVEQYWTSRVSTIKEFDLSFRTLSLVDVQLNIDVGKKLEEFEDHFCDYIGSLRQSLAGTLAQPPARGDCIHLLVSKEIEILKLIQKHQVLVGIRTDV